MKIFLSDFMMNDLFFLSQRVQSYFTFLILRSDRRLFKIDLVLIVHAGEFKRRILVFEANIRDLEH